MRRAWAAIAVLAASWLVGLGYYHHCDWGTWLLGLFTRPETHEEAYVRQADWLLWGLLVAAGTALLYGIQPRLPGRRWLWVAAALMVPAVFVWPWPYVIIPMLAAVGFILAAATDSSNFLRKIGGGLVTAAAVLLAQAGAMYLYEAWSARSHELPGPLANILADAASLLGQDSALSGNTLGLHSMREMHRLGATWELFLDPATLAFLAGGAVLLWILPRPAGSRGPVSRLIVLAAIVGAWLPVRAGLLIALYMHRVLLTDYDAPLAVMDQFWSTPLLLALLAGPVLVCWKFLGGPAPAPEPSPSPAEAIPTWRPAAAVALTALATVALLASLVWEPVGARRGGRVLVDEYHSRWESTKQPMDTEWYGHLSGYNYACIYDYLTRFYSMGRLDSFIGPDTLDSCDVLILKCPTPPHPFSPEEIDRIHRFVERGGGLVVIGEHTNVFGTGEYLNSVCGEFGFQFRYDCAFGIDSVFEELYRTPLVPHPIVQRLPPLDFAVSCSIAPGDSSGSAAMRAVGLKCSPADYHASNFYPAAFDRPDMRYGACTQLWATRYGKGRVVAFSDSTQFSNFSAFEPGKPELMLGMIEWANRTDGGPWTHWALFLFGFVLLVTAAMLSRRPMPAWSIRAGDKRPWIAHTFIASFIALIGMVALLTRRQMSTWALLAAAIVLGHATGVWVINTSNRAAMPGPLPAPNQPMVLVTTDRTISGANLPRGGFIAGKDDGFGIFERWILRLGYFTERTQGTDFAKGRLAIIINPSKDVPADYTAAMEKYVRDGGRLLVLDSPTNYKSTANTILAPFGLEVLHEAPPTAGYLDDVSQGLPNIPAPSACEVRGGVPLSFVKERRVATCTAYGRGTVTVIGFSSRFSDAAMGVTGDLEPDSAMRQVYEYEFALLRAIVTDNLPTWAATPAHGN
jgi:hypothetical protein